MDFQASENETACEALTQASYKGLTAEQEDKETERRNEPEHGRRRELAIGRLALLAAPIAAYLLV